MRSLWKRDLLLPSGDLFSARGVPKKTADHRFHATVVAQPSLTAAGADKRGLTAVGLTPSEQDFSVAFLLRGESGEATVAAGRCGGLQTDAEAKLTVLMHQRRAAAASRDLSDTSGRITLI